MENNLKPQATSDEIEWLKTLTTGLPPSWAVRLVDCGGAKTKRLHYVRHVDRSSTWIPPPENWRCPNFLPYGWELGIDDDGHLYYINHLNEVTTRRDPRLHATLYDDTRKEFLLEKNDDAEGFGFILSESPPYVITSVDIRSAAAPWLNEGDIVSRIGNIEVFELSKEELSELLLKAAGAGTVKIQVLSHDALASSNESQPETNAEGKLATHLLPGVLCVELMTGGARKFRITKTTTVQDIVDNVCKRSDIMAAEMFGLYIETVSPECTTLKTLYGWQPLAKLPPEIIATMASNEVEGIPEPERRETDLLPVVRIVCRLRFLPGSVEELLEIDARAFEYFFHQTVHDIANDLFSSESPNDVAITLGSLSIAHFCLQQGRKKVNIKDVEKSVGGLQPFFPSSVLNRLKPADLRKHAKKALDAQCLDLEQEDVREIQLKYLNLVSEFPSLGGAKFTCIDGGSYQAMTLLVSPVHGFCSIDSPLEAGWCSDIQITTFCSFDGLESIKVEDVEGDGDEPSSRVTINFEDSSSEPGKFILKRVSAREMVHLLQGYATLLAKVELAVEDPVLMMEIKQETDKAPSYRSLHHVVATPWSYLDLAWEVYMQMMKPDAGTSLARSNEKLLSVSTSTNSVSFPVGKLLVDKSSLSQYMAVDLSVKLSYGKRRKRRLIYLRKTGADLAQDFLNKPEVDNEEDEEDFTAHLSSRQMVNSTATAETNPDSAEESEAPKQKTSAAAAALASLLSRSAPVVDESEGSATAQPLRGLVAGGDFAGSNSMNFSEGNDANNGTSSDGGGGWSGGGTAVDIQVDLAATGGAVPAPSAEAAASAGWGDEDDTGTRNPPQPTLSDFGVSVRGAPRSFGFGDNGPGEEDEIGGW